MPEDDVGREVAHHVGELVDRGAVQHERVVAAVEEDDFGAEDPGGLLGLRATDRLDLVDRLPFLLPQLARLTALAERQRDDRRRAAVRRRRRDRAGCAPDEVGRVRADDEELSGVGGRPHLGRDSTRGLPALRVAPGAAVCGCDSLRGPRSERRAMAARTTPPFRADHVGSLLRPPELLARARATHAAGAHRRRGAARGRGRGDPRRGRAAARRRPAGRDRRRVPAHVVAHGLHLPARRHRPRPTRSVKVHFHNEDGDIEFATAALQRRRHGSALGETIFGDDFEFLAGSAPTAPVPKLTIPSPSMVHYRGGRAAIDERRLPGPRRVLGRPHRRVRARRCAGSASSAAPTSSSTTRASPT